MDVGVLNEVMQPTAADVSMVLQLLRHGGMAGRGVGESNRRGARCVLAEAVFSDSLYAFFDIHSPVDVE